MFEYLWLPCMVTVAGIAISAILFREFLKKRADQIALEGRAVDDSPTENGTVETAAHTCTSPPINEMATSSGYDYEVFLSFRGPDTRSGFTDYLYTSLTNAGIRTFKDDEDLRIGKELAPELLQAINQSKISIPIFSKNYASSVWCLKELVQMVKCHKSRRQQIMPIFYDVAPSEVQYQTKSYGDAFHSHEKKKRYDKETMGEWRVALSAVGALKGWDLHNKNRLEGEFTKTVTRELFHGLKKAYLKVSDHLVNVDNHVNAIMEMIDAQMSETQTIGIYGMGGIGKTTVAKIIYNQISKDFEHCCFLSNVRETSNVEGIKCLQHQLISDILKECPNIRNIDEGIKAIKDRLSNKRVLLLLDDVEKKDHMNALVGNHDWFGKGSKIIVTTRNKEVLKLTKVDNLYEVNSMDPVRSLQLFSKHAFRRDSPLDEYIDQSNRAIRIAQGLPLALEVIGSLLSCTEKTKWDDKLERLAKVPHEDVQNKLKISYDALGVRQQQIFLDIACLFIGYNKDITLHFWEKCKFFPKECMEDLSNRSLIKIDKYNKLWMHDQLRDLGREMVHQESNMKIHKQSRVWDPKEALDLLKKCEGKTKVEALRLHFDHERQYRFTCKDFERISNLKFLQVDSWKGYFCAEERLFWHEPPSNVLPIDVSQVNSNLLPELRWLSWSKIPPTFNITNFSMEHVVILDLSMSEITHDWKGWSHMKVMKNLKVMNLTRCYCLERSPDFSAHSKLERLILQHCCKLVEIDTSIGQLKSLVFLDVRYCGHLQRLPDEMGRDLVSLEYLLLSHCNSLERLPNTIGNLELLNELNIYQTGIKELPDSIEKLKNLKVVNLTRSAIRKIPNALWTIEKLKVIEAKIWPSFNVEIGNCIYRNPSLRILRLMDVIIYVVPRLPESLIILELSMLYMDTFPDLSNLTNLKKLQLQFRRCHSNGESDGPVEEYPCIGNLSKLESMFLASPYMTTLPTDSRSLLPQLKSLTLQCPNLRCVPSLPSSLSCLELDSECVTTLPMDMRSLLPQLQSLKLRCPNLHCLPSPPSSLLWLQLNSKCVTTLPTDMSSLLPRLKSLFLWCPNLRCLPSLPPSLIIIYLKGCNSCYSMEDLSNLKTLSSLYIQDSAISEIRGLDHLENLKELKLGGLQQVEILPDLSNLNKPGLCLVYSCGNLVEIQGELPPSLESLLIEECGSLQKLPDLSSLKKLKYVEIKHCGKLNVEAISSLCSENGVRFWEDEMDSREKVTNLDVKLEMDLREKTDG